MISSTTEKDMRQVISALKTPKNKYTMSGLLVGLLLLLVKTRSLSEEAAISLMLNLTGLDFYIIALFKVGPHPPLIQWRLSRRSLFLPPCQ